MKYIKYYILGIISLGILSSCMIEDGIDNVPEDALARVVFTATLEESEMATKTILDENVVDGIRGLLWEPEDLIGVARYGGSYRRLESILESPSANGVFEGWVDDADSYYAVYPYRNDMNHASNISVNIPVRQTYRENSFDMNMAPMVGRGDNGSALHFQNLCGVLAVQMTGTQKVTSISFETNDGSKIAGDCSVSLNYNKFPLLVTTDESAASVTLDCGEGVQLDESVPTVFHIVLAPGTYNGVTLTISTAGGQFMEKTTDNQLTITRSLVTKAASFSFENNMTDAANLSAYGHSNCYVISEDGFYSFDADVIGNGEFGIIEGAGFHTSSPSISPVSVELLWEDRPGLIKSYGLDTTTGKVKLMTSGKEGNALMAVKDAEGMILWSWHIWMTDRPADQNYENDVLDNFVMLDRNIGAIRADRGTGDEWMESIGLYYQWGRKDPFAPGKFTNHSGQFTAVESLKYPTEFGTNTNWTSETQVNFWDTDQKTIYDPCPVGYRVPVKDVWYGFTSDGNSNYVTESQVSSTIYDNGWSFYRNSSSETTWYPVTGYYHGVDGYSSNSYGYYWSANKNGGSPYLMYFRSDGYVYQNGTTNTRRACNIRCMKDDDYESTSLPVVKHGGDSEYTTTSIRVSANISYSGWSEVTDRGFIFSVNQDMSEAQTVSCGSGRGEFSYMLEELTPGSVYYVKAYAVNSYGTSYSDVKRYRTMYSDDDNNLSKEWVANCYRVDPTSSSYFFDATSVGNGGMGYVTGENFYPQNPEIIPHSVELLWADMSEVISDLMLQNGQIHFMTNDVEGNAVVAVKDANGAILWSWHIWVTDQPAEHTYNTNEGKTFVVMDRYLGSTSSVVGDSGGALYYQWGRKDPFMFNGSSLNASFRTSFLNLSEAISAPMDYPQGDDWVSDISTSLWSKDVKTIYDPCPEGWRVPSAEVWSGIRKLMDHDNGPWGVVFGFSDSDSFWYPDTPRFNNYGDIDGNYNCDRTEVWTAESGVSYFMNYNQNYSQIRAKCDAYPVRCMKDE